jgi:hypothetical protein
MNHFVFMQSYDSWKKSQDSKAKNAAKIIDFVVGTVNDWDFDNKVENGMKSIHNQVDNLLKSNSGVLIKIVYDISIMPEGQQIKHFQGVQVVGAGSNSQIVKQQEGPSIRATVCSPDALRLRGCVFGATYLWVTKFGIENA